MFVMKFVPRTLKGVLATRQHGIEAFELHWQQTLSILKRLAKGIQAIISEQYVVGDIKPDNVLIDEDYNVYLCDFGSAKKGGRELPTKNYYYSAKEISILGAGDPQRTDVYSYGVILLQMLMKDTTFDAWDLNSTLKQQVNNYKMALAGKKNKKAANSSTNLNPHVAVKARVEVERQGHVVHKSLMQSGCSDRDAVKITELGIQCTEDEVNRRPFIETIISTLEELKINKKQ